MKKKFIIIIVLVFNSIASNAQPYYEVSRDVKNGSKVLKGIVTKNDLVSDTAFAWYAENQKNYTPFAKAVEAIQKHKQSIHFVVFIGTWCQDSKFIIPKFFSVAEAAGFPDDKITMLGTDRTKTSISHLSEAFQIVNIPTIVIMKDGKEVGRVVEYGKFGMFEIDLAQIINSIDATKVSR